MKIVVLGGTGMLGYQVFKSGIQRNHDIYCLARNKQLLMSRLGDQVENRIRLIDDAKNISLIECIIKDIQPEFLINCVGIIKQSPLAYDHSESIAVNSLLPHQLENICSRNNCRLIHISTDCVFDGTKGNYYEQDLSTATDLYGKSKFLGEVGYGSGLTIRTSIIGHEITNHRYGLLEWFLSQKDSVNGYTRAIFSGLTTFELSRVIFDFIINSDLKSDIYQVASEPVSKFDLLKLIASVYRKDVPINPTDSVFVDRSLIGDKFSNLAHYKVPSWKEMIEAMYNNFKEGF